MDFLCPRCGAALYVDAVRPGEQVQCGVCHRMFPVAEAVSNAEVVIDMEETHGPHYDKTARKSVPLARDRVLDIRYQALHAPGDGCCGCNGCGCLILIVILLFLVFGCMGPL